MTKRSSPYSVCVVVIAILFTIFHSAISLAQSVSTSNESVISLQECDAAASHPNDPRRTAPGVSDEQLIPGRAIQLCEKAVQLNPTNARAKFELARAYWLGQDDKKAFRLFAQAGNNYPPALKYIGDAYLEGRGLPKGENQDANTALVWYKRSCGNLCKSASTVPGFPDARNAVNELTQRLQEERDVNIHTNKHENRTKASFNIFQMPEIIKALYNGTPIDWQGHAYVAQYLDGFISEMHEKILFLNGGQFCAPLISAEATSRLGPLKQRASYGALGGGGYDNMLNGPQRTQMVTDAGRRDALMLFNKFGCESGVSRTIIKNMNIALSRSEDTYSSVSRDMLNSMDRPGVPGFMYKENTYANLGKPVDGSRDENKIIARLNAFEKTLDDDGHMGFNFAKEHPSAPCVVPRDIAIAVESATKFQAACKKYKELR
ncbi:MAG: sel1 repeat family protein [Rhodocyclaceae bacterium]|nr:sel1 repeat family protein [Rhodocyclaceae bacterium]MBX3667003.1 sel1 repeat family protein [Rhodocyclaceae bacterium]